MALRIFGRRQTLCGRFGPVSLLVTPEFRRSDLLNGVRICSLGASVPGIGDLGWVVLHIGECSLGMSRKILHTSICTYIYIYIYVTYKY